MTQPASIFYDPKYLKIQNHEKVLVHDTDNFKVVFNLENQRAASLPNGLFGSFEKKNRSADFHSFEKFWDITKNGLKKKKISRVEIVHPPSIYAGYVAPEWMEEIGFSIQYEDINHHIPLGDFQLHDMERRKLEKLGKTNFEFTKESHKAFDRVYDFLNVCRMEKGLELNIRKFKLARLFKTFPQHYDIFCGRIDGELACAAITLKTADGIVYYFLPATLERFKKQSPMVGLLDGIVKYFREEGQYLDLGISSMAGSPQEGLIVFKERMGGISSSKKRLYCVI